MSISDIMAVRQDGKQNSNLKVYDQIESIIVLHRFPLIANETLFT